MFYKIDRFWNSHSIKWVYVVMYTNDDPRYVSPDQVTWELCGHEHETYEMAAESIGAVHHEL